jgi:hypothetical protein
MRIISDFLLFSPLEQFEISSFNNSLSYTSTFGLENLENKFFSNIIYTNIYNIFNLIFLLSFVLILQTNIKQKGFLFLFVFIYILTVGFN